MASARETAEAAVRKDARDRWLLTLPAAIVIMFAAVGPLFIMLVFSFLQKSGYGGVIWNFSLDGWTSVFLERDIFDDTLQFADEFFIRYISVMWL